MCRGLIVDFVQVKHVERVQADWQITVHTTSKLEAYM